MLYMSLVSMKEMLQKAAKDGYAVGQFNINNLEWTQAILETAQELQSPVILGVSEGAARYMGGYNTIVNMVKGLLLDQKYTVPVAIHLDHGSTFESCKAALDAGFTSVMIDGSHLPLLENIAVTKQVVEYAKSTNASVEAELGIVGGQEDDRIADGVIYADPQECLKLVTEAGVDCLAAALGSVHGPYSGEPKLGFDEMEQIHQLVKIPLVLHGGSGIPDVQIEKSIARGTAKINVNTECQQEFTKSVREALNNDADVYDPRKFIGPGKKAISAVVKEKMLLFKSDNKA